MNDLKQVGGRVSFYEPGQKLKRHRLTGVVKSLTHDEKSARVCVTGTNRHVTIKCSLLRYHGELDEVRTTCHFGPVLNTEL